MPAGHRARWLEAFIDGCDLSPLEQAYAGLGSAAYRPDLMIKVVLLEVFEGRPSPAQWARDVRENEPPKWIGRGIRPSRTALYDFRDRLGGTIQELHASMVQQAIREGLIDPRQGVQDGTFTRACASRHRTINLTVLQRRHAELQAAIAQDELGQSPAAVPRWMAQIHRSGTYAIVAHDSARCRWGLGIAKPDLVLWVGAEGSEPRASKLVGWRICTAPN